MYYNIFMRRHAQGEDQMPNQDFAFLNDTPTPREMKNVMKAARRARQKARKVAARRYDGLQS